LRNTGLAGAYINARITYYKKIACKNCLPDDDPMRLETCRRCQKSN